MIEIGSCQLCNKTDVETIASSNEAVDGLSFMDIVIIFTSDETKAENIQLCFKCQDQAILAYDFMNNCNKLNERLETEESIAHIADVNTVTYEEVFGDEDENIASNYEEVAIEEEAEINEEESDCQFNAEEPSDTELEAQYEVEEVTVNSDFDLKEKFVCGICGAELMNRKSLSRHMFRHENSKSLKCPCCPRTFYFKRDLNTHVKKHNSEDKNEFRCEICHKNYSSKSSLQKHLLIHTEQKQFKCTFEGCDKKFLRLFTLEQHLKIHNNEKQFKCNRCSASFIQLNILIKHFHMIHKEGFFKCEYCKKENFFKKSELYHHYQECNEFLSSRQ